MTAAPGTSPSRGARTRPRKAGDLTMTTAPGTSPSPVGRLGAGKRSSVACHAGGNGLCGTSFDAANSACAASNDERTAVNSALRFMISPPLWLVDYLPVVVWNDHTGPLTVGGMGA